MRILFVNHTGAASGAEYALLRLVGTIRGEHHVAVACPSGALADMLDDAAVQHVPLPAFEPSLRLHPLHTPFNLARMALGAVALRRAVQRFGADLVHANTPRAGLAGVLATRPGGPPLVVRAHEHLPLNAVGRSVRLALRLSANAILTVSKETARRLNHGLERPVAIPVYNSFDRRRFDPDRVEPAGVREQLDISPDALLLGQVGQITPWKAQDTSIRVLGLLRQDGVDAHLLIAGSVAFSGKGVRYDNQAYLEGLHRLIGDLGLRDRVHFLGQRSDVPGILSELDLSLLPSWDEPFANVMLESMAMRTPLLVSSRGGGPELVEDQISGRVLEPRRPELWAKAVRELLEDREALGLMGERARQATEKFDDQTHAREMLNLYGYVLRRPEARASDVATAFSPGRSGRFDRARQSSRPGGADAPLGQPQA